MQILPTRSCSRCSVNRKSHSTPHSYDPGHQKLVQLLLSTLEAAESVQGHSCRKPHPSTILLASRKTQNGVKGWPSFDFCFPNLKQVYLIDRT